MSKTTGSLIADIHKKEEKVKKNTLFLTVAVYMQVAELTKEWASKWKDIQQILMVISTPISLCDVECILLF